MMSPFKFEESSKHPHLPHQITRNEEQSPKQQGMFDKLGDW